MSGTAAGTTGFSTFLRMGGLKGFLDISGDNEQDLVC